MAKTKYSAGTQFFWLNWKRDEHDCCRFCEVCMSPNKGGTESRSTASKRADHSYAAYLILAYGLCWSFINLKAPRENKFIFSLTILSVSG